MAVDGRGKDEQNTRVGRNYSGWNVQEWTKTEKKMLQPVLQRMLPRRAKGIEFSSYWRSIRVKLLPHNPHFAQDIGDLRFLFKISLEQIAGIDVAQAADRKTPSGEALDDEEAAGFWLEIHRCHFLKIPMGDWVPVLPKWFMDSASTSPLIGENAIYSWLRKEPSIPGRFAKYFDLAVPLDRCSVRLIERYQLPWLCGVKLQRYLITGLVKYLRSIFPFDVEINEETTGIGEAFNVTVDAIDEFMTKQQWGEIFDTFIKPRQTYYWERRGELPHSRQATLETFRQDWVLEIYLTVLFSLIHMIPLSFQFMVAI